MTFSPEHCIALAAALETVGPHSYYPTDTECQQACDALRSQLSAALAEVERMRGVYEAAIAIRTTPKCMCSPEQRDESCPAAQLEARLNVAIDHAITTAAAPCSICGTTKQPPCRHTAAAGKDSK